MIPWAHFRWHLSWHVERQVGKKTNRKRKGRLFQHEVTGDCKTTVLGNQITLMNRLSSASTSSSDGSLEFAELYKDYSNQAEENYGQQKLMEKEEQEDLWNHARHFLLQRPGAFFWKVVSFYSERRLIYLFGIHLVATLVIWAHFFLVKFQEKRFYRICCFQ